MWHIVFSFYNSQNYSAFYYEEVTAFELSTSKVKTAVSTTFFINVFVFFPVFVFVFVFVISRWIQALSNFHSLHPPPQIQTGIYLILGGVQ